MIKREYWTGLIQKALKTRPILWLRGVRRSGKTVLCRAVEGAKYFDCEIPEVRKQVSHESFLKDENSGLIVLDEVHKLDNPAQILKIAADHYPKIKIIATGSSSLETIKKFSDTLTGRKNTITLTPATFEDSQNFGVTDIKTRMLLGGLPPFLLQKDKAAGHYAEWVDSYWSRDILELFRLEKRESFIKLVELILNMSGIMFDATKFSDMCEVSRHTVKNYMAILETTGVACVIRPFAGGGKSEIVSMPKVYGFDTGFVTYAKGWDTLRGDDFGLLWEQIVLNELTAVMQERGINYWRDKAGHEVDFVVKRARNCVDAIECKWQYSKLNVTALKIFRKLYPEGVNYVISHDISVPRPAEVSGVKVKFIGINDIRDIFGKT